ncbi:MAG TPA: hypothetical protein VL461_04525 [Dictyobacter sp.]|jgi:hypothetical protein|nr:hypothetical protein [Dictyobacter sp.]
MIDNDMVETEQALVTPEAPESRAVDIPGIPPVKRHTFDLARHLAQSPDGKNYVVATYDDRHMGRGYVTSIFPQQGGYLTLVRLPLGEISSQDPEEAVECHISVIRAIQQGKIRNYLQQHQK